MKGGCGEFGNMKQSRNCPRIFRRVKRNYFTFQKSGKFDESAEKRPLFGIDKCAEKYRYPTDTQRLYFSNSVRKICLYTNRICLKKAVHEDSILYPLYFNIKEIFILPLNENVMENGIYVLPHMTEREGQNMDGLFMFASVCLASKHEGMGVPLVKSLILKVILAFIVTWLLLRTRLAYNKQVGFITVIGVVIALGAAVPPWIWAAFPIGFTLACLFEIIVGWFLAGLVIAKVTK